MMHTYKNTTVDTLLTKPEVPLKRPPVHAVRRLKNYRFFLISLGFVTILLLPALDQFANFSARFVSTEKRRPAQLPTFHFPHLRTYIHDFNQYYKENFGWRNALFYQYSRVKYYALGTSPLPQKAILGKNGWFFPGNDISNVVDQHLGLQPLSAETLQRIAQKLRDKQQQLAAAGIKFYVVVAPDSYSIYPEELPDHIRRALATSNFDLLKTYITRHTSVALLDVRPALLAAKSTRATYLQTDTHWNEYGALVAAMAIARRVKQDFSSIHVPSEKEYSIQERRGSSGDLVCMLAMNGEVSDAVAYHITPPARVSAKETGQVDNTEVGGLPSQRFIGANAATPRLLFIGDSFTLSLAHVLPGFFATAYMTRSGLLHDELIRAEKPDVVIFEIVERNLAGLADL